MNKKENIQNDFKIQLMINYGRLILTLIFKNCLNAEQASELLTKSS